jgi:AcrR family transcriptional regulator
MSAPTPQQDRAIATRRKLIDATIEVLATNGVAGTATSAVAREAGVSQGALFRHFPSKAQLLSTATAQILADLFDETGAAFLAAFDGVDPVKAGVDALWTIFTDRRIYGAFEVFLAARTDAELRALIEPILLDHAVRELEFAKLLFPKSANRTDFDRIVFGILSTLQGAALVAGVATDSPGAFERQFIEDTVRQHLGVPASPGG